MYFRRSPFVFLVLFIVLSGVTTFLKASYYKPDFFPIGLTGLGLTGWDCPYQSKGWYWDNHPTDPNKTEKALIDSLGVNCIGCEDAWHQILIDFAEVRTDNTYLEEVLTQLTDSAGNPTVYLITASYGAVSKRFDKNIIFKYTEVNL